MTELQLRILEILVPGAPALTAHEIAQRLGMKLSGGVGATLKHMEANGHCRWRYKIVGLRNGVKAHRQYYKSFARKAYYR